jgi:flavin reductase (DIM6/NTAB) family NADH-FMN oxidoreductase RutF
LRGKIIVNQDTKKTALRMIPYGMYVLTGESKDGKVAAATVNWVTQTSFEPPLVVVGVKVDSGAHQIIKETGAFGLNILSKEQKSTAFAFFKTTVKDGNKINGEEYRSGTTGSPILKNTKAYIECSLIETVERGDHSVFIGEVKDAGFDGIPEGRPDDATLTLKDLGDKTFYGG